MKSKVWLKRAVVVTLAGSLLTAGAAVPSKSHAASRAVEQLQSGGQWMVGEYHNHTYLSDDAQESLEKVLDRALEQNDMDWIGVSDHLRMVGRDDTGAALPGGSIPLSKGIELYQLPKIKQLVDSGKYEGKIIFTGFEWDMPTYDHVGVGILPEQLEADPIAEGIRHFEYLFTNRDEKYYDPAEVSAWKTQDSRAYSTKADARKAVQWLKDHYPDSFMIINHPSRKRGTSAEFKIEDLRDFNNIAPEIAFGFEGMLGNQMAPDRGEVAQVYGGTDIMVAQLGGVWDALLGEGRRFWNFANSDFHFHIDSTRRYSSGYMPGDYSKNHTWVDGSDMHAVVEGMRSGKSFSVFGDLIDALDFRIAGAGGQAEMGEELQVTEGDDMELTIRFKSPASNYNGDPVQVDHVDLIAGDVTGYAEPGTPEYTKSTNDTTKVLKRFTSQDWTMDEEGYHVITYKLGPAEKNKYFRLRGTNLGTDVPGETSNGEPLIDVKNTTVDNETRFEEINRRNFSDLWFYSNPIFVNVDPYSDRQAVDDTAAKLSLGDTSAVVDDLKLPVRGEHGVTVQWDSSHPQLIGQDGRLLVRYPAEDTEVTLTATIARGTVTEHKTFVVTVKGFGDTSPASLSASMKTADGVAYASGQWTNQSVVSSVYAVYSNPVTEVELKLSLDGGPFVPYAPREEIVIAEEGRHTLTFQATDNLHLQKTQDLQVNIDRTAPVITLRGTPTVNLTVGAAYEEAGADASDNIGLAGEVQITGTVNTQAAGTYILKYHVSDLAGNPAKEVIRTVVVSAGGGHSGGDSGSGSGGGSGSGSSGSGSDSSGGSASTDDKNSGHEQPEGMNAGGSRMVVEWPAGQGARAEISGVMSIEVPAQPGHSASRMTASVVPAASAPLAGHLSRISPVVALENAAEGSAVRAFNPPAKLTLNYETDGLADNRVPAIYYYDERQAKWIFLGGKDTGNGTVTADVRPLAKYAVFSYQPVELPDLKEHWAQPFAYRLIGMQAIQGFEDRGFHPNEPATRAQFTKMLVDALGLSAAGSATPFADDREIPAWAKQQAAAAFEAGLVKGAGARGKLLFNPGQALTRAELAVMLAQALPADSGSVPAATGAGGNAADAASIPAWAAPSVKAALESGLLTGDPDGSFRPNQAVTRAEAAAAVYRLLEALNR